MKGKNRGHLPYEHEQTWFEWDFDLPDDPYDRSDVGHHYGADDRHYGPGDEALEDAEGVPPERFVQEHPEECPLIGSICIDATYTPVEGSPQNETFVLPWHDLGNAKTEKSFIIEIQAHVPEEHVTPDFAPLCANYSILRFKVRGE